jgi:hypothetical protein
VKRFFNKARRLLGGGGKREEGRGRGRRKEEEEEEGVEKNFKYRYFHSW